MSNDLDSAFRKGISGDDSPEEEAQCSNSLQQIFPGPSSFYSDNSDCVNTSSGAGANWVVPSTSEPSNQMVSTLEPSDWIQTSTCRFESLTDWNESSNFNLSDSISKIDRNIHDLPPEGNSTELILYFLILYLSFLIWF